MSGCGRRRGRFGPRLGKRDRLGRRRLARACASASAAFAAFSASTNAAAVASASERPPGRTFSNAEGGSSASASAWSAAALAAATIATLSAAAFSAAFCSAASCAAAAWFDLSARCATSISSSRFRCAIRATSAAFAASLSAAIRRSVESCVSSDWTVERVSMSSDAMLLARSWAIAAEARFPS